MTTLREWLVRLWNTVRPGRRDEDLEEELRLHLELAIEEERRRSHTGAGAERAAGMHVGGVAQTMESMRDQRGLPWLDELARDVRYAVRTLRKSPSFATVAILTLGLGIGATTAIYTVVDTILLQPLQFRDSDRLVRVVENIAHPWAGRPPLQGGVTYREFEDWRDRTTTLSDAFAVATTQGTIRTSDGLMRLWGSMVSTNTFPVLGVPAMLGRTISDADAGNPNVVVLSFATWQRLFHADSSVLGAPVEFQAANGEGRSLVVIGVMPATFELPTGRNNFYTDFYIPFLSTSAAKEVRPANVLIGRLRPDVSLQAAIDEANNLGAAIRPPRPDNATPLNVARFDVLVVKDQVVRSLRPALRLLLAAVGVLLAIVCANVANLLLARGAARQRELAVRFAIGASRGRVVRQLVTECLVLAVAGGALGALLGAAGISLVKRLATVDAPGLFRLMFGDTILPRGHEVGVDPKMFGIAFGVAAVTALVFGLLPALHLSRADQLHALGSRAGESSRRKSRMRAALVVGQLVMATLLLVGAGLLINSFARVSTVERGYDPSNVLAMQLVFPTDYSIRRKVDTIEALLARLRASPDVASAGFTRAGVLIQEEIIQGTFVPHGRSLDEMRAEPAKPLLRSVSRGFLTAMGVPLLAGREFEAGDDATAPPVIVITRIVATRYFGSANPVGQFVDWHVGAEPPVHMQVVGVVEDVRNTSPEREASPEVFIEYRQLLRLQQPWGDSIARQDMRAIGLLSFAIRTRADPTLAVPFVSQIVRAVDPNAGIDAIIPLERLVASSVARQRFYAVLLGVFAAVAGFLAAIGVYGVLAYAVVQRTREIGVRMALGAQRAQVLRLVLRTGATLTAIGVGLGLVGAAAGAQLLQGMLFGVSSLDPATFVAVSLLFGLMALLASYMPARRATKVDPVVALRTE